MDELRKPLFFAAVAIAVLIVCIEIGANWFPTRPPSPEAAALTRAQLIKSDPRLAAELSKAPPAGKSPPGVGIPDLALLDGLLLLSVLLMGASFLVSDRLIGRVQGVVTLIVSLLTLIAAIVGIFKTLIKVLIMFALFTAVPFGTIAYLAIWGFFNRGGAATILGFLLLLKLAFTVCLILAHQNFLQRKGLMLLILTSLLANIVVSFLHGLVPVVLVSITDGVAGIIVLILAAVWAIILLVGSVIAVIKAIV